MAVVGVGVAVVGVDFPSPKPVGTDLFRRDFQTFSGCRRSVETAGLRAGISPGSHPMHQPRADGTGFGRKGTARHRAGTNRAAGAVWTPIFLARRCGPEMQMPRASVSASKILSGPSPRGKEAVRTRIPSAPAPSRHRIPDHRSLPCPAATTSIFLLGERHSSKRPVPQRGPLFEQAFRFASTVPGKPPTFHPASRPRFHPY